MFIDSTNTISYYEISILLQLSLLPTKQLPYNTSGRGRTQFLFDIKNTTIVVIRKIHFIGDGFSKIKLNTTSNILLEDVQMTYFTVDIIPVFSGDIAAKLVNCAFTKSHFKVKEDFDVNHMYISIVNCKFSQSLWYAININAKKNFMSNFNTLRIHFTKVTITNALSPNQSAIRINLHSKLTSHSESIYTH